MKRGMDVLRDKALNRGLAFTRPERERLGVRGLLPYVVASQAQMVDRVMVNLDRLPRDIDRYMLLSSLQERNEGLFFRAVIEHIERIMPLIYTPTVGEACKEFSHLSREPKGFFITPDRPREDPAHARQLAPEGRPRHRRHRRAADPRAGRPRSQRHGHSRGQAGAVHGVRGHPAVGLSAGDCSTSARTTRNC